MRSPWKTALCVCLLLTASVPALAQQKLEMNDAQKVRRADIVPEPAPTRYPRVYPGTSFRSLRVPEVRYGYVQVNDKNIFYERVGYGEENIIVVHGGPGLPHNYLLPALQNLGQHATLWFYDARGHGLSEQNRPNDPYSMEQLVDDLEGFASAMGFMNYSVLGHSFGGMVALHFAARRPEGLQRLILSDTAPSRKYGDDLRETLKRVMPSGLFEKYEAAANDESITPDERLRRAMRIVYPFYWYNPPADYYLDQDINTLNLNARANAEIWSAEPESFDITDQLGDISVPTLVMVGRHDIVTPVDQARIIKDKVPNSYLVVFEHSGHYPFYEENSLWVDWIRTFMQYHT